MLNEYMEYRCSMYYWLKSLYITEPTVELLEEISKVCGGFEDSHLSPEWERNFIGFFANLEDIKSLQKDIKVEYARLFLGPKEPVASPYESVYTTSRKQLFGESAHKVKAMYKEMGVEINTHENIPEDFIGYELEFMYYLTYFTIKFIEEGNTKKIEQLINYQKIFVEEHLANWISNFTNDIVNNTTMEYFKVLGNFTKEFIVEDLNSLTELI